jgi:hypothetical protein
LNKAASVGWHQNYPILLSGDFASFKKGNGNMTSILDRLRRLFRSRRQQRYVVKDGTFVVITPSDSEWQEHRVQLIDISQGGMAFIYQGSPSELEKSGILKTLEKKLYGEKIKFDMVYEVPVPTSPQAPKPLQRRGVKFKWMGSLARSELKSLINTIGICEK